MTLGPTPFTLLGSSLMNVFNGIIFSRTQDTVVLPDPVAPNKTTSSEVSDKDVFLN